MGKGINPIRIGSGEEDAQRATLAVSEDRGGREADIVHDGTDVGRTFFGAPEAQVAVGEPVPRLSKGS